MAYQLKYYKGLISQGHRWRLEIYQDTDESLQAVEIGPVLQGLRLIVQGDQADIDTPIVKTSMEMVFVDAPDLEEERKCGYWEEFYTSSATEYKVMLIKDDVIEWTGFITPDSFSESLQYRGSVTIIARDNLGALQDFEYDAISDETVIKLHQVLDIALQRISFPMHIAEIKGGSHKMPESDTLYATTIEYALFNSSSFRNKTWNEVIEYILFATGLTLRYVGHNTFALNPIRDIPLGDYQFWWDVPILNTQFCAYGQRELSPAAKSIVDELNFEIEENFIEIDMPSNAYGSAGEYEILTDSQNIQEYPQIYEMPIHAVIGGSWGIKSAEQSLFLNPFAFPLKEGYSSKKKGDLRDASVVYLAANNNAGTSQTQRSAEWKTTVGPGKYKFSFVVDNPVALYDDNTKIGHIDLNMNFSRFLFSLRYVSKDGSENYEYRTSSNTWNSGYTADPNSLFPNVAFPVTYEFPVLEVSTIGEIQLVITYVGVVKAIDSPSGISKGAYVPFKDFSLIDANLENTTIPGSQKITTRYSDKNNILIHRNVKYGFNSGDVASPHIVKNGMYVPENQWYESSEEWIFNDSDIPNPLPVLIHKQLLAYYAKPNNVLSGELAIKSPAFNALYEWNGKMHLLTSGALNVITGRMENVVLREFMRYDHMWETWVENEDIEVDYIATSIELKVHSTNLIALNDVQGLPIWLTLLRLQMQAPNVYIVTLGIDANTETINRKAIILVKSAFVRITQLAPGDYGMDYGEDYS